MSDPDYVKMEDDAQGLVTNTTSPPPKPRSRWLDISSWSAKRRAFFIAIVFLVTGIITVAIINRKYIEQTLFPTDPSYPHGGDQMYNVRTVSGSGTAGYLNSANSSEAQFNFPSGVAVDGSKYYITDLRNNRIRGIYPLGTPVTTTAAGNGQMKTQDGYKYNAAFNAPVGIAINAPGEWYVTEVEGGTVRKVIDGNVTTVITGLNRPVGIAVGKNGLVITEETGFVLKFSSSMVQESSFDGVGSSSNFSGPSGVVIDSSDNIYFADEYSHVVRKIDSNNTISVIAGNGTRGYADGVDGVMFNMPRSVALSPGENSLFISDMMNHVIRELDLRSGNVTTVAGTPGVAGKNDGIGKDAKFNSPAGLAMDREGLLVIVDQGNHMIRSMVVIPPSF